MFTGVASKIVISALMITALIIPMASSGCSSIIKVKGTVAGQVFQNEKLMANYEVQIVTDSGNVVGSAKTNNNGHFIIQDVPPGTYNIQVLTFAGVPAPNFQMTIQVRPGRTETIKVNLGGPKIPEPTIQ